MKSEPSKEAMIGFFSGMFFSAILGAIVSIVGAIFGMNPALVLAFWVAFGTLALYRGIDYV